MKKTALVLLLAAACCMSMVGCKAKENPTNNGEVIGGYVQEYAGSIDANAQKAFDKAMEDYTGGKFEPITVLGTQVVAGTNYAILCNETLMTQNAEQALKIVVIFEDLDGSASVLSVNDFSADNVLPSNASGEVGDGAWMVPETVTAPNLDKAKQAAFDKAYEEFVGSKVEVMAYLGSQVVAGTNYRYLCKVTPVVPDAVSTLQLVVVYEDLEGNASFENFYPVDIAAYIK